MKVRYWQSPSWIEGASDGEFTVGTQGGSTNPWKDAARAQMGISHRLDVPFPRLWDVGSAELELRQGLYDLGLNLPRDAALWSALQDNFWALAAMLPPATEPLDTTQAVIVAGMVFLGHEVVYFPKEETFDGVSGTGSILVASSQNQAEKLAWQIDIEESFHPVMPSQMSISLGLRYRHHGQADVAATLETSGSPTYRDLTELFQACFDMWVATRHSWSRYALTASVVSPSSIPRVLTDMPPSSLTDEPAPEPAPPKNPLGWDVVPPELWRNAMTKVTEGQLIQERQFAADRRLGRELELEGVRDLIEAGDTTLRQWNPETASWYIDSPIGLLQSIDTTLDLYHNSTGVKLDWKDDGIEWWRLRMSDMIADRGHDMFGFNTDARLDRGVDVARRLAVGDYRAMQEEDAVRADVAQAAIHLSSAGARPGEREFAQAVLALLQDNSASARNAFGRIFDALEIFGDPVMADNALHEEAMNLIWFVSLGLTDHSQNYEDIWPR